MEPRIPGFPGEYLWELDIARIQLLALANAVPQKVYDRRPAEGARTFSAVLVHIAAGNYLLLDMVGAPAAGGAELYHDIQGEGLARLAAMVRTNVSLERTLTEKQRVIELLERSFDAVRRSFTASGAKDLDKAGDFFGERTTVRRVYLRMLAHTHEHMGQAIAYVRSSGLKVPWPDPLKELDTIAADS